MPRSPKPVIILAAAAAVGLSALAFLLGGRASTSHVWTDGEALRIAAAEAPVREVLWSPAAPLPGGGFGSTEEYEPRYSADGTMLVFVRRRAGANADLYASRWSPSGWTDPAPIESVNTEHDELGPELSRDGESLFFYSDRPGGLGGHDLWVARRNQSGWSEARNLGPRINSPWNEYGPALTPGADRIYFSSNRPLTGEPTVPTESWDATLRERRTRGDYDLFSAAMVNDEPEEPAPLAALNSPADEGAPEVSPSGDFLYFASDRGAPDAVGGFDLYRVRIVPKDQQSTPENLGSAVNSSANDLDPALSSDGFRLCFSSDRIATSPLAELRTQDAQGRYSLWSSVSREVYREVETVATTDTAWSDLWPWLLLLALLSALTWLLVRLVRDERWRRRFGQLSLIAQCLLLSLLIHAAIASLLTVWKVGSGIIELIQSDGGGTRVVLSSGAPGGSIVTQVRGVISSAPMTAPEPDAIAAAIPAFAIDSPSAIVSLPELVADPTPPLVDEPAAQETGTAFAVDTLRLSPTEPNALLIDLPQASPSPAHSEAGARSEELVQPAVIAPALSVTSTQGPSTVDITPMPMGSDDDSSTPLMVRPASSRREAAIVSPSLPRPESIVDRSIGHQLPSATPPSARIEESVVRFTMEDAARSAPVAAPEASVAIGGQALSDLPMRPMSNDSAATAAREPGLGPDAAARLTGPERSADGGRRALAGLPPLFEGTGPSLPVATSVPSPAGSEETRPTTSMADALPLSGPSAPLPTLSTAFGEAMHHSHVPALAGRPESRLDLATPPAPSTRHGSKSAAESSAALLPPSLAGPVARLPSEPVVPVETFDQRAPEVRGDLVEQMGGSSETERAVGLALQWFARHQHPDGHWSAENFDDDCGACGDPAEFRADAAMTGMALLCYLGAGHTHAKPGPYQSNVERGLRWLIARQSDEGDLRRGETMYGQTVGTVALCEALAMTGDQTLALPARRGVQFVLARASNAQSGDDRETSVLGWLVFTVESARRAGIDVPRSTFTAAERWLDYVTTPGSPGRYAYTRGQPPSAAMTAEAMFVRQLLGHTRSEPMMQRSAEFILDTPPSWKDGAPTYYWYYATLALFQHQGDEWKAWNDDLVRELLRNQQQEGKSSGSWDPQDRWSRMGGRVYQTAVCTLCLEVYYRYKAE